MEVKPDWGSMESAFQQTVKSAVKTAQNQVQSRAVRAANALRNAALEVLRGQRSGRKYRKPFSKGTYTASAPGEAPAVRTGTLRRSWSIRAAGDGKGRVTPGIHTDVPYAPVLEEGGDGMAQRPYREAVVEKAKPAVKAIFTEPYLG